MEERLSLESTGPNPRETWCVSPGKEVEPSKNVQDRIDLLALDKEGSCVVIELKRGTHKLHMLQAISYAAMVSQWQPDDFLQLLDDDQQEALSDFLEVDKDQINRQQRIILIAETYDYGLLVATEWLSEKYEVNIICCRIAVATDPDTKAEYLACSIVYPAPELATAAVPRGRKRGTGIVKWADWEAALAVVDKGAIGCNRATAKGFPGNRVVFCPQGPLVPLFMRPAA